MTLTTRALLDSPLSTRVALAHLDTSDHREISNVGRVDIWNVVLALKHGLQFLALLARARPDVVYVPIARNRVGFLRDLLFLVPARLMRKEVVLHLHSTSFVEFADAEPRWMRALIRAAFGPRTHGVVLAASLRGAFGRLIPPERVHVIPNGIPDVGRGGDAAGRGRTVLHLTTMWSEKGLFDVLDVAARVRETVPDARFVLAGPWYDEDERREAHERLSRLGLREAVEFVGAVGGAEKARLLHEAALLLFPSRYRFEAQPLVVLEALAAGTPVVTTPIGVLRETFDDGSEGFFADYGDTAATAAYVARLLEDVELRSQMSDRARARYDQDFRLEQFAERVGELLESTARGDGARYAAAEPVVGPAHD